MAAMARRYGPEFSMRIPLVGPCVVVTDPAMIKEVFQKPTSELAPADPDLSVMLGSGSTFGLRGEAHRQRRKLLAPPFHGKRMRAYEQLVEDETLREISTWPSNVEFEVMPSTMRITLNIILRAVFGADGTELHELRDLLPRWVEFGSKVFVVPFLHRDLGRFSPWGRHLAMRRQFDAIMETLITKALADPGLEDRDDVLSMLLRARYDDGTAMTHSDIGDELVTLLAAGHETTATTLAWTLERLRRHPDVLRQLVKDIDAGESKMLQTTVFETQRVRPVIDGVARRVVADNLSLGRWVLPRDHRVWISATAVHNDPSRYPDPNTFNPDRFLDANPDNFTWVPFGGGTRRCIGAAFANMEMTVVLRTILRHYSLVPTTAPDEKQRFRGVAFAPARGGLIRVQPRPQQPSVNHPRHLADGAPLSQGR
jgi:cytochrome P450